MKKKAPLELLIEKSAYLKIQTSKLVDLEKMIELLNERKSIISDEQEKLSEFDANERKILLLKTDLELSKLHKTRIDIKADLKKFTDSASEVLVEIEQKWDSLIVKAWKEARTNSDLKQILDSIDAKLFEENIDVKVNYYLQIKAMVYPKKSGLKVVK